MTIRGFVRQETPIVAADAMPGTSSSSRIDPAQRSVLDLADGASAAVIGAPGTGKTRCVVELVAERVLGRGYEPAEVLVLAPSRAAATRLRDRIAIRLGVPTNGPIARTANSVSFQIVRAVEPKDAPVTLLTGGEQDAIIAELLQGDIDDAAGPEWPEPLVPEVRALRGFRTELRELMMRCSEYGISPPSLVRLGLRCGHPEWVAAAQFMAAYADNKDQHRPGQFDSAELAAYAAAVVRSAEAGPNGAGSLGTLSGLRLIVVDDSQDATESTIALLRAFAGRGVAVVAFGDPDVATTAFRGARSDVLGGLARNLGLDSVERIVLSTVHRGRPALREIVTAVTGHIGTALAGVHRRADMAANAATTDPLPAALRVEAPSHASECAQLARILREHHLLHDVPWSRMAVVLRSGSDIPAFERGLALSDVPTRSSTARRALRDDPAAARLLEAARLVIAREPLTAEFAVGALTGPLGRLDAIALRRLRLSLRQQELGAGGSRTSDELIVEAMTVPGGFDTIDSAPARRAGKLAATLAAAASVAASGGSIEEVLWQLWERSGLAAEWGQQARGSGVLAEEANRSLDGVVALFSSAQRYVERTPSAPAGKFIDDVLASDVPEDSLAPRRDGEAVVVCTPSAVVGEEFDIVVVAGLQDGVWPNLKPRGSLLHADRLPELLLGAEADGATSAADERAAVRSDELRMFALAISRACRQLVVSCTSNDDEQASTFLSFVPEEARVPRGRPLHMRGLVGSLRRDLVERGTPGVASALALLAHEGAPGAHPDCWYGLAEPSTTEPLVDVQNDPEARVRVSPSQIEKAERSPLAWFVDTMASSPSGLAASIGTIVHAAMETVSRREDGDTSVDTIWAEVEERWKELRFEAPWLAERELRSARRMATGLSDYLTTFSDDGKVLVGAEGGFEVNFDRITLSGSIDRVERSADGTTVIVDLKTGKRLPTITGMPEHPQLAAYQLAFDEGAFDEASNSLDDPGRDVALTLGGAKLVFVANPANGAGYTERVQQPFDAEAFEAFRERVRAVAAALSGARFDGPTQLAFRDPLGAWEYRIHLVPAVSA
ncbi:PD-(D/E)XK nuclease family protein [Luethyella okanaganae]|uniref:DNA 3'-5' helicase n=1 Tax=Luethyella okanaganae TaxID=69372 RepID=A0ABW1VEF6_9MICO